MIIQPQLPPKSASVRQPVLLGLFTGTAIGAGYLLAGVPNLELMTLVIALCGAVTGAARGMAAGIIAAAVYSLGSPYGLPVPLLLMAQAAGMGAAGLLGAWGGNHVLRCRLKGQGKRAWAWAAATGAVSTMVFDVLTNLAIIGAFDLNVKVVAAGALPLALLHVGSNILIFALLMPVLLPRLSGLNRQALSGRTLLPLWLVAPLAILLSVQPLAAQDTGDAPLDDPASAALTPAAFDSLDTAAALTPAAFDSLGTAAADTAGPDTGTAPTVIRSGAAALGWRRPLWQPFARTATEWLQWYGGWLPVLDGGLGARAIVLGEAGQTSGPLFLRDGVPLGTGHGLAADLWLVPVAGLVFDQRRFGHDGWGGTGGVVASRTDDPEPDKAYSAYRGVKGRHETYFRSIRLLTPQAAWRVAFEFEESLDVEGYNYSGLPDDVFLAAGGTEFPGHSRVRQSRARLSRTLDPNHRLVFEYSNGRLTKDALPVFGAEHLEVWDDALAVTMESAVGSWEMSSLLFWRNRDLQWGDRGDGVVTGVDSRLLETGREGLHLELRRPAREHSNVRTAVQVQVAGWHVSDSLREGPDWSDWQGDPAGRGQDGRLSAGTGREFGAWTLQGQVGANWESRAGLGPEAGLVAASSGHRPWLTVDAQWGGRAPRSDELLTPMDRTVAGRELILLPNPDLGREKSLRLGVMLQGRLAGLDLALDGSMTRLREGISWRALAGEPERGRWENDLALDARRLTGTVGRQGRLLGWARAMLEGTWQSSDEIAGRAGRLPPSRYLRSNLHWENHYFQEDGILQLALLSTLQGEMGDPWDVTRRARIPARLQHDLLVGFRLAGAHLSLGLRNLTGARTRLTSGAVSTGQELDLRLDWSWVY